MTTASFLPVYITAILMLHVLAEPCPSNQLNFQDCDCTWNNFHIIAVNCTNAYFLSHDVLGTVLSQAAMVRSVTFRGNYIPELSPNLFGTCQLMNALEHLTYLDLSNNSISQIHGQTLHCVPNLEVLKLNHNQWVVDVNKNRIFSSIPKLRLLHLEDAFAKQGWSTTSHIVRLRDIFANSRMWSLQELHLEHNELVYVDSRLFCELPNLHKLFLSHNNLTKIDLECLDQLEELHFEDNHILALGVRDQGLIGNMTSVKVLTLKDNQFQCTDCTHSTASFRYWLHSNRSSMVADKGALVCQSPTELRGKYIYNVTDGNLEGTCDGGPPVKTSKQVITIIVGMVVLSLLVVAIVVVIINKDAIRNHKGGCWKPFRDGARNVLRDNLHYGYATMTDEEMCNVTT